MGLTTAEAEGVMEVEEGAALDAGEEEDTALVVEVEDAAAEGADPDPEVLDMTVTEGAATEAAVLPPAEVLLTEGIPPAPIKIPRFT